MNNNIRYLYLISVLLASPAQAFNYAALPQCEDSPVIEVPLELQGSYVLEDGTGSVTVDNRGIRSDSHTFTREVRAGKEIQVTEEDFIRRGYCVYSELETGEDGKVTLKTQLNLNTIGKDFFAVVDKINRFIKFDPRARTYDLNSSQHGFGFLLFIPLAGAGGFAGKDLPLSKVADFVEQRR